MNVTTHKLLTTLGVTLAAVVLSAPHSTPAKASASAARVFVPAPPRPGLRMQWSHPHARAHESLFGSTAVVGLESMSDLAALKASYRFAHVQALPLLHAARVRLDRRRLRALLAAAPTDPRLRYVSPVGPVLHTLNVADPLVETVDPLTKHPYEWQVVSTNLERALELSPGDPRIQVGVIDSGVDAVPDLAGKIDGLLDAAPDGVNPSPSTAGNDDFGHGTAVASLIAAGAGDGFGMTGFGGAAHVIGVHAGANGSFTETDVATALAKLASLGVRIVNLSLGGSEPSSPIFVDAIHKAASDGMLIVAAAGNDGSHVSWPAAYLDPGNGRRSYGLAVGATNIDGSLATFSNFGNHLSLVAPGNFAGNCSGVLVALPTKNALTGSCYPQWRGTGGAGYGYVAGTSFSSPEVAGVAALVWAARPELTNYQVADIIKQSAQRDPGLRWTARLGCGRLDAGAAVELALSRTAAEWAVTGSAPSEPCSADGFGDPTWPAGLAQTITFDPIASRTTADRDFTVSATSSSGLPVGFAARGDCIAIGSVVHVTGPGLCGITASQDGDDDYDPAPDVMRVFAIAQAVMPKALSAHGRTGGVVSLRYRVVGGRTTTVSTGLVIRRDGVPIAHRFRGVSDVKSGHLYSLAWRAPHTPGGASFSFCVTLHENMSPRRFTSCAPIRLDD